jgi:hypothetical protein
LIHPPPYITIFCSFSERGDYAEASPLRLFQKIRRGADLLVLFLCRPVLLSPITTFTRTDESNALFLQSSYRLLTGKRSSRFCTDWFSG